MGRRLLLFVVACSAALVALFAAPVGAAPPRADDCPDGHASVPATARLTFDVSDTDVPEWSSTVAVELPRDSQLATSLLEERDSEAFDAADACLLGFAFASDVDVAVDEDVVTVTSRERGQWWSTDGYNSPDRVWSFEATGEGTLVVSVQPNPIPGAVPLTWTSVTVVARDLEIARPSPVPATMSGSGTVSWTEVSTDAPPSVAITVPDTRRAQFFIWDSGFPTYLPLDLEAVALALAVFLLVRRTTKDPCRVALKPLRATAARLAGVVLALWTIDVFADLYYAGGIPSALYAAAAYGAAQAAAGRRKPRLRHLLWLLAGPAVLLQYVAVSGPLQALADTLYLVAVVVLVVDLCHSTGTALRRPRTQRQSPRPSTLGKAGGLVTLVFGVLLISSTIFSGAAIYTLASVVVVAHYFAILFLVALTSRDVPVLLDRSRDRALVALILAEVILASLPSWYLGTYLGLGAVLAFASTMVLLAIGSRRSHLSEARGALAGVPAEDLRRLKAELNDAERRRTRLVPVLRSLEGRALTPEELELRHRLQREQESLERWPTDLPDSLHSRLATAGLTTARLPRRSDPVELALAIGPDADPADHLVRAMRFSLMLAALPVIGLAALASRRALDEFGENEIALVRLFLRNGLTELAFWVVPVCVLAVGWGTLAGRRGSSRALQVWLCVAVPFAGHWLAVTVLDQATDTLLVLRISGTLLSLLVFGLLMDLATLRTDRVRDSAVTQIARYYQFGRAVAVMTLVIPLLTAGLSIWNGVRGGLSTPTQPAGPVSTNPTQDPTAPADPEP